ncbi:MAG: hypothetical protein JRF59_11475 [Deltaproteobacteria bacterium]|nr:hypothetical protein [Deltaproteobacteria bacterium]
MLGLFYTLFKGAWMPSLGAGEMEVDLLTVIIAFIHAFRGPGPAGLFAFCQGAFVDTFSGGAPGVFTSLYLLVFAAILVGCRFLDLQAVKGQILIALLAVILRKGLFLVMIPLFSAEAMVPLSAWAAALVSAGVTGLACPVFFAFFQRFVLAAGIVPGKTAGEEV